MSVVVLPSLSHLVYWPRHHLHAMIAFNANDWHDIIVMKVHNHHDHHPHQTLEVNNSRALPASEPPASWPMHTTTRPQSLACAWVQPQGSRGKDLVFYGMPYNFLLYKICTSRLQLCFYNSAAAYIVTRVGVIDALMPHGTKKTSSELASELKVCGFWLAALHVYSFLLYCFVLPCS
jgi:hypothetical protein